MDMYTAIFNLSVWLVVFPICIGVLPAFALKKTSVRFGSIYCYGFLFMLALLQFVAVPFVVLEKSFSQLLFVYRIALISLSVLGFLLAVLECYRKSIEEFFCLPSPKRLTRNSLITYLLFFALFLFQIIMSVIYATPNDDDAYYVTQGLIAANSDKLYTVDPYTGAAGALNARHALAPLPLFFAVLSRVSGIHTAIIAHSVLPPFLILLTYMIYYKLGHALFDEDNEKLSIFLVLIAGIQMFGATSIYTSEVFFLTRTWQGKSILANVAIPAAFLGMLYLSKKTETLTVDEEKELRKSNGGIYFYLVLVNLAGALASSMGILLLAIIEMVNAIIIAVRNKNITVAIGTLICQIPSAIYLLLYLRMR